MRFCVIPFGCQMNESDAELASGLLTSSGYERVEVPEEADIIIVLTCCVRESAESRVHGRLGALKPLKSRKPGLIIGVGGCMPQRDGGAVEIMGRHSHVDLVFGTHNLPELPRLLEEARTQKVVSVADDAEFPRGLPVLRRGGVSAWVRIMRGCDNFCSYCIVPYVRGKPRSRLPQDVRDEVRDLGTQGYKQVVLLGQNVNAYGKDLPGDLGFANLLRMLDETQGIERIRYTTSHPRDFDMEMVETIRTSKKVCEHFHLPCQSGSNRILDVMKRGYTREYYVALAHYIRERIPGASITTDIIVGFPTETERDFEDTLDVVRQVGFDSAFTFLYSPRSGTPAAEIKPQVPLEVRKERLCRLIELQKSIALERNQALEGARVEVLVEGPSHREPSWLEGRTRTNKCVHFEGDPSVKGQLVTVAITHAGLWSLRGIRE